MFDHNGQRTRIQSGDVISFRQAPGAGTLISVCRPLATEEKNRELVLRVGPLGFQLSFFPFEQCGELASFIAELNGLTVVSGKTAERGDLRTAEFEVREAA